MSESENVVPKDAPMVDEEIKEGFEVPKLQLNGKPMPAHSDFLDKFESVQFPHINTLSQHME